MDYLLAANDGLKILVGVSILFVWVVRYHNIVEEFKLYHLPDWLRDLVGILKITFAIIYVLIISIFLWFFFQHFSIQDFTSYELIKDKNKNLSSKNYNFFELDNLSSKSDFI